MNATAEVGTFLYSVIRAVPHSTREDSLNIGVVLLAEDESFANAEFASLERVRLLNPRVDLKSIEMFVEALSSKLPSHGRQLPIQPARDALSPRALLDWSREFGGLVRVSEPRVMIGSDPDSLLASLYKELVAPIGRERRRVSHPIGRADILHAFDREVGTWQIAPQLIHLDETIHGKTASHRVDRVVHGVKAGEVAAIVEAISFALEPVSYYGARASLIVATDDLRERKPVRKLLAYALYADAPKERIDDMRESARLFELHDINPVNHLSMEPIRKDLASVLAL